MIIDLRSDTVTRPSKDMLAAMLGAETGDDVLGDDPTVQLLEEKAAAMFGMESALFCASGTLTNQLAIRTHTRPGSDVICDKNAHIYQYEGGGIMVNSLCSVKLLDGDRGRVSAAQVEEAISPIDDIHATVTRLVSLENTMNKGGGSIYDFEEIKAIRKVCQAHSLPLHLDGARLFNALVETGETTAQYGAIFDSVSICLSKGLGCPVGSILIGSQPFIKEARRHRKVMGGGWRQAGILAAAGIFALDHHIQRLKDDHTRAKTIGQALKRLPEIADLYPIDTNIVIFKLQPEWTAAAYVERLNQQGIKAVTFGRQLVRMVTHMDFTDTHLEELTGRLARLSISR